MRRPPLFSAFDPHADASARTAPTTPGLVTAPDMDAATGIPPFTTPSAELQAIIDEHERADGSPGHQFQPSRLILLNCWVFGYQEFPFVDGHLVLNGGNGSGKTTALTAAMPVALFGTTGAGALDTMDGRARTVEYLVLGSQDDERDKLYIETGRSTHILWEFVQPSTGRYLTVGQILSGSRAGTGGAAGKLEKRSVIIRDGRRVGKTLRLWDLDATGVMQPWTAPEVAERLVDPTLPSSRRNLVTENMDEYRRAVAHDIFGTDQVREVIAYERTLRAMRRPMLNNKEFKPEDVAEMLRQSLPELDANILDQLDSSLNGLDQIRIQLQTLEGELAATADLAVAHERLVSAQAEAYAKQVAFYEAQVRGILTQIDGTMRSRAAAEGARAMLKQQLAEARAEREAVEATITALQQGEGAQLVREHQRMVEELTKARGVAASAHTRLTRAVADAERAEHAQQEAAEALRDAVVALAALADELRQAADAQRWALGREAAQHLAARCGGRAQDALPALTAAESPAALLADAARRRSALEALRAATRAFHDADEALGRARAKIEPLEEMERQAEQWHKAAMAERDRLLAKTAEELLDWGETHRAALPAEADVEAVVRAVRQFNGTGGDARRLLAPLREHLRGEDARRAAAYHETEGQRNARRRELTEAERRLEVTRQETDHVPTVTPAQQIARAALAEAGVAAVPLYAALEVHPEAPDAVIARLEQVLLDAHCLDALLVAPADAARARMVLETALGRGAADRWLLPDGTAGAGGDQGLAGLVYPADGQPGVHQALPALLASWQIGGTPVVEGRALWLDLETGQWRHGILEGRSVATRERAEFLGLVNRKAERAQRIARLEEECDELQGLIQRHEVHLATLASARAAVHTAQDALDHLVGINGLAGSFELVRQRGREHERARQQLREATERIAHLHTARAQRDEARLTAALPLPELREASLSDLDHAAHAAASWIQAAHRWPGLWIMAERAARQVEESRNRHIRAMESFADETEAHADAEQKAEVAQATVAALARQLESAEVRELQERLQALLDQAAALRTTLEGAVAKEAEISTTISHSTEQIAEYTERLKEPRDKRNQYLLLFVGYIRTHAIRFPAVVTALEPVPDLGTVALDEALAKSVVSDAYRHALRHFVEKLSSVASRDLDTAQTAVNEATLAWQASFLTQHVQLESYALEWERGSHRVTSMIGATRLTSLDALIAHLQQHVQTQRAAIEQQEDELYKSVFLDQLSSALRHQIRETRATVQQLNEVLAQRPLHDGEVLSVQWRPVTLPKRRGRDKAGDLWSTEEEIERRKQVVAILTHRELSNASDEDQAVVYRYFRDRLSALRTAYGRAGTTPGFTRLDGREISTFRAVLATAFDYRQWYEFGIMARQHGAEKPQEITYERFVKRSGGQRVAATLVPLLAALEVRCRAFGAASPAPRLIALDEAFAGVDEENTEALFHTLAAFDMSWVMTSEKLTGSSPALRGAMTAVLTKAVRPHAPSVVAVHYLVWDGTFELDVDTAPFRRQMLAAQKAQVGAA
jgi:hypothetical protein